MKPYEEILARADRHFSEVEASQPDALQCRLGCTLCCHGLFEISPADLVVVMEGLRALDSDALSVLVRRSREIVESLDHPDLASLDDSDRKRFFDGAAADEACPALSTEGACTIYSNRPLLCRTFGLPIREGAEYRGEECELNFTSSSRSEKERAAWDLEWEDIIGSEELYTMPQAILVAARVLEAEDDTDAGTGLSIAEGAAEQDRRVMYRIACPSCGEDFEATTARWCHCLNKDRSLICPSCRTCFCTASSTVKNQVWRDAPEALWNARRDAHSSEGPNPTVLKKPLVLVVDDDPAIRSLAVELVTRFGHGCISASNARRALRLAHRYHPDLVLTDLLMPGLDGRELSRELKSGEHFPAPKVVVMTSVYRGEGYEIEARGEYGVDDYLEKPVPMDELREKLAQLLPPPEQSQAILDPSSGEFSPESLDDLDDDAVTIVG